MSVDELARGRSADELDILTTEKLNVTLISGALWVGRVLPDAMPGCTWPLLKCLMSSSASTGERASFFSFTQDEEELTLIMDEWSHQVFEEARGVATVTYGPRRWRAFELRLGALAWEVPGVVSFVSSVMAESNISILKVASYDRDFLLVQESDVSHASKLIQERLHLDVDGLKEAMHEKLSLIRQSGSNIFHSGSNFALDGSGSDAVDVPATALHGDGGGSGGGGGDSREWDVAIGRGADGDVGAWEPPTVQGGAYATGDLSDGGSGELAGAPSAAAALGGHGDDLYVKVLPTHLVVVRLQIAMLPLSTHALAKRLLFSRISGQRTFWSYTHADDEVSLIIDELSLPDFPDEALVGGSSTRWVPLKLTGKSFAFDETGVVSAMFAPYDEGVPLLNISTFSTNVTLVEESDLQRALAAFELPHRVVEWDDPEDEATE